MRCYVELLLARNQHLNLTAARTEAAIWEHIADSLTLAPYVRGPHVDVGSGGGFPAIPLAIATGISMVLVESLAKKARFLEEVVTELGLDAQIVNARAEDVGHDPRYRGGFASVTARAVAELLTVLELTVPLLRIGGRALLQRGELSERERDALEDAALVLGARITEEIVIERSNAKRILLLTKYEATPLRYPRRSGVPQKRPLCGFP